MNHSISRAKKRLEGRIFSIQTEIETFDFQKGFTHGLDKEYDLVKREANEWFQNQVEQLRNPNSALVSRTIWDFESTEVMSKLWKIYASQSYNQPLKFRALRLEVQAGSLGDDDELDYVWYNLLFETGEDLLYSMHFSLSENELDPAKSDFGRIKTEFEIQDTRSGEEIPFIFVPTLSPGENEAEYNKKAVLIYFTPPLPPNSGPYVLKCRDIVRGFVGGLKDGTADYLQLISSRATGTVDTIDLILHIPEAFPDIRMLQTDNIGRSMSKSQLASHNEHPGFRRLGWNATNVNSDSPFRVELLKNAGKS